MSFTRRVAALALVAAATTACGGTRPVPATDPAPPVAAEAEAQRAIPSAQLPIEATASLAGTITTAADRTPLPGARVTVTSPALTEGRVAITDAQGRYEILHLPPGTYAVQVTRTGYAPQRFGEGRGAAAPAVSLAAGQRLTTIDVALAPAGAIAGRVLDEDGTPLAGATVEALVPHVENGRRTFVSASTARTDALGEFRLGGLAGGHYYVSAFRPASGNLGGETRRGRQTPTYFPGVAVADEAQRVAVKPRAEPQRIEFRLRLVRPSRVSGVLTTPDGRQLVSAAVVMTPLSGESLAPIPASDIDILPDGRFTFRNVPPGRYQIRARGAGAQGATLFATFIVLVDGGDTTNVTMMLRPGGSLTGTVVLDSDVTPRASLAGVRVRAPLVDDTSFGDAPAADVGPDGAFEIRDLTSGARHITLEGLPSPWVLKNVTYRGRDITDLAIDVEPGDQFRDVRVTVTDRASELAGTVHDERGAPVDGALVVVVPRAATLWTRGNRRIRATRSDAGGRYRLRGLPPGEYRAFASLELGENDVYRREVIEPLVESAIALTIAEHRVRLLDLPLLVPPHHRSSRR